MIGIYYFDLAAIILLIILIFVMISKKMYKTGSSKILLVLILFSIITSLFDVTSCFPSYFSIKALEIYTLFYHLFRNSLLVLYLLYVLALCDIKILFKKYKYLMLLSLIPIIVVFTLILLNPINHNIFYYDNIDNGNTVSYAVYHRNSGIIFNYTNSLFYFILTLLLLIKNKIVFTKRELIALTSIFPLTLISLIVQFVIEGYLVELFATAISALLLTITTEKEIKKEKFDIESFNSFIKEIKKAYLYKINHKVLIIKIKNYYEIYNQFNYKDAIDYINTITLKLKKKYMEYDKELRVFYLEDGMFSILFSNDIDINDISKMIIDDLSDKVINLSRFIPDSQIINLNLFDLNNYKDVIILINNLKNILNLSERIINYDKLKEDKNYKIITNLDKIITDGLKNNEFEVYFQPIYNVKDKKYYSAEALVRLFSKEYGFISPGLFIPYAEKSGKVVEIDYFVFEEVCKFISSDEFKNSGLKYIEVNLSVVDCINDKLYEKVKYLMDKYNVMASNLNVEITESYDSLNKEKAIDNIDKLKELGIKFSLDDYGTGYSNIERFSTLPITHVKIDKSLVDSSDDSKMQIVLKNTFDLIKALNRVTIIEGIETKEQSERFIKLDCDNIQGYYYSKPLNKLDFINFIYEKNEIGEK